jgi:hypothetical protein
VRKRAGGSFRQFLLAALLALTATLYVAGPALADGWESGGENGHAASTHSHR